MKKLFLAAAFLGLISTGCRKIEVDGTTIISGGGGTTENTILEGRIVENRTLKAQYTYKLRGLVYVTNGAVLTIEPGTKIVGETGKNGGLIICRSAKIIADGTVSKPIVFTSEAASPVPGDWAGLVLLGNAPTNASFNGQAGIGEIEGGINNSDGLGLYGLGASSNPADNSGILRYVRIEYAGYAFLPDKEINGLTMGGVGNQTIIDYVQVYRANDDSFEWFGGTVNCKHLIAYKGLDDDWDVDNGFSGKIQFGISMRDSSVADISRSNGFEVDNDASGSTNTPQTSAVFSNMTVIGPRPTLTNIGNSNFGRGMHLRRNSSISIFNSIILGWPVGLLVDAAAGRPTDLNLTSGTMVLANNILASNNTQFIYTTSASAPTGWTTTDLTNYFNLPANANSVLATNNDVALTAPFKYDNTVDYNPAAGSPALTGAAFTHPKLATGFAPVTHKGAAAAGDTWWKGWTKFGL